MSGLKGKIAKMIPMYKTVDAIYDELMSTKNQIEKLKKRIDDLDKKNDYLFFASQQKYYENEEEMKKQIFLSLPPATGQLRELQLAENMILQRVKDICDKIGIQFFLIAGTLIGAIRHHGFIPWDDDIDIGMMEDDCEKLRKYLLTNDLITMKRYYLKYGSMIYKIKYRFSESVFIDIFPYTYLNCDKNNVNDCWNETQKQADQYCNEIYSMSKKLYPDEEFNVRPQAISELDIVAEALAKQYKRRCSYWGKGPYFSRSIECGAGLRRIYGILAVEDEFPLLKDAVEFEGMSYDILKGYEQLLIHEYDDIWTFPSIIKSSHYNEFVGIEDCINKLKEMSILK